MNAGFLIGSGAGFSGDRVDAPQSVVKAIADSGKPGAIIFETLAERTLALGQVARRADPGKGYEPLLEEFLAPILSTCHRHGIAIIGNFGAANPRAAAKVIRRLAREAGHPDMRIAVVEGDDIRESIDLSALDVYEADAGLVGDTDEIIAANVYMGARAIADALTAGAQIVITGRVADPSLAVGPLVAHFGWDWDDWDRIASATLAGHLLECGAQVTGGYFGDPGFKEVPSPENIGFPIAEVAENGDFVITKAPGTGGCVNLMTVKEQLLYEIHDPARYLTPDVVLDVTGVSVEEVGPDRVLVTGAKGRPRPPTLKVTVSFPGDWLGEAEISYAGPNAMGRARAAADVIRKRIGMRKLDVRARLDLIGALSVFDSEDAGLGEADRGAPQEVRMRLAVSASDKTEGEKCLQEVLALYCCGPAGGGGVRSRIQNRIKTVSYLVAREAVTPTFFFHGEATA
ncbi:MAG: acyclic terpene utilization AtuA family protein [Burkholderiaceae bacterium]